MLLACHERIRSFSALAVRLAGADDTPPESLADAAARLHRYFTVALPLHVIDEETSLRPRLIASPAHDEVAAALALMSEQHGEIERQLAALTPAWSTLASAPERIDVLRATREPARDLERLLHDHLALEEQHLFPAAARDLDQASLLALRDEMRDRRSPGRRDVQDGPLGRFLVADHVRLAALLARATADPERIDLASYGQFRAGLLRHIGMEEKILLPAARRLRGGEPLAVARQLRLDHAALAALLVPTPTRAILDDVRALLAAHHPLEEAPGGLYATCDELAASEAAELIEHLKAAPEVPLAPHFDGPSAFDGIARHLRAAGRRG